MAAITASNVNALNDKFTAQSLALIGTLASTYGAGDGSTFGGSKKQFDLAAIVAAFNDVSQEAIAAALAGTFPNYTASSLFKTYNQGWLSILNALGAASGYTGVTSWDALLTYYNVTNGPYNWGALAPPDYLAAMQAMGITPSPLNIYLEVLQGASWQGTTFTNALGKDVKATGTDTNTLGYVVDPTKFAGGFAYVNVTAITGSGVVTVTGLDQAGNAETWTATVSATGRVLMTPSTHAYSLITKVLTIATAAGITAATLYIEANRPAGRTNPPT